MAFSGHLCITHFNFLDSGGIPLTSFLLAGKVFFPSYMNRGKTENTSLEFCQGLEEW